MRTIEKEYSRNACFDEFYGFLRASIDDKNKYLVDVSLSALETIKRVLSIDTEIVRSSSLGLERALIQPPPVSPGGRAGPVSGTRSGPAHVIKHIGHRRVLLFDQVFDNIQMIAVID